MADYDIRVRLDPEAKTLDGRAAHRLAQPVAGAGRRAVVPPVPERVQELEEHASSRSRAASCAATAWRRTAGAGSTSRSMTPRRRRRPRARRHLRAPRRRQRRRPDGVAGAAARAGAGRRRDRARRRVRGEAAADLRAHRLLRATTSSSASGSRSSASTSRPGCAGRAAGGWNCHQFHANSEFYADFGRYRVEITLPTALRGRGDRRAHAIAARTRTARPPTSSSRPTCIDFAWTASPRFLEVKSTLLRGEGRRPRRSTPRRRRSSAAASTRCGSPTSRSRCSSSRSTRSQAERHVEGGEGRHQVVRPLVRPLPLPHADRRRPRLRGRRLGRDGVPDLHHRRHVQRSSTGGRFDRVLAPGGGDRPRVRPPVLAEHGGLERVRGVVARRGLQHLLDGQGHGARLRPLDGAALRPADRRGRHVPGRELRRPHVRRDPARRPGATRPATTASTPTSGRT